MSTTNAPPPSALHEVVVPGQEFVSAGPSYHSGPGTFQRNGKVYASVIGTPGRDGGMLSVESPFRTAVAPHVGALVTGTVTKVVKLQAHLSITMIDGVPLLAGQEFQGVIRSQDVRKVDKDRVVMIDCFRPGDIVRAEVISLPTGTTGYLLATFANHLGVVFAENSTTGNTMLAVSWTEMADKVTGQKELRKVAGKL